MLVPIILGFGALGIYDPRAGQGLLSSSNPIFLIESIQYGFPGSCYALLFKIIINCLPHREVFGEHMPFAT
jgi:hypothetical protein